jgi:hypothetical protein
MKCCCDTRGGLERDDVVSDESRPPLAPRMVVIILAYTPCRISAPNEIHLNPPVLFCINVASTYDMLQLCSNYYEVTKPFV